MVVTMKISVIMFVIGMIAGAFAYKTLAVNDITAGACVDAGTKSLGQKWDEIMGIINE